LELKGNWGGVSPFARPRGQYKSDGGGTLDSTGLSGAKKELECPKKETKNQDDSRQSPGRNEKNKVTGFSR